MLPGFSPLSQAFNLQTIQADDFESSKAEKVDF
jgi:hypothetical protein